MESSTISSVNREKLNQNTEIQIFKLKQMIIPYKHRKESPEHFKDCVKMYQTWQELAALKVVKITIFNTYSERNCHQNENISILANQARISSVSWNNTCNKITIELSI